METVELILLSNNIYEHLISRLIFTVCSRISTARVLLSLMETLALITV